MTTTRKIDFWDCDISPERLYWDDRDEAIEMHLDERPRDEWPELLTVHGFSKREKPDHLPYAERALERMLEELDEEYGDPEGDLGTASERMRAASKLFARAVISEYEIWTCECTTHEEIDVMKWVKEHCPDWLNDPNR